MVRSGTWCLSLCTMNFFLSNFIDLMKQLHRLTAQLSSAQLSYGQDANEQVNGVLFFHENTAVPFTRQVHKCR